MNDKRTIQNRFKNDYTNLKRRWSERRNNQKNRRLTKIVNLLKQPNKIEGLAPLFLILILSRARKKGKGDLNKKNK